MSAITPPASDVTGWRYPRTQKSLPESHGTVAVPPGNRGRAFLRKALAFAANYSRHLDARANLPTRRLNRVPTILRELLTWRYHEYANGFKSAAKDLVS